MDLLILDKNYDTLCIVDTFISLIWTERYRSYGDFELYMPVETPYFPYITLGNYVMLNGSNKVMIIEDLEIKTDAENGDSLTVTGRSFEAILDRRIVWEATVLSGSFQDGLKMLFDKNIVNPSDSSRKIPGFVFKESTDPRITSLENEAQYLGEDLYSIVEAQCTEKDVGFQVKALQDTKGFEFSLYFGTDRSYAQNTTPWVVFSPGYDNLFSSDFYSSSKLIKTDALVSGQNDIVIAVRDGSGASGLERREVYVQASGGEPTITYEYVDYMGYSQTVTVENPEYKTQLVDVGEEYLAGTKVDTVFDGEIDATRQYVYGKDFFLGDIVQIQNAYGMEATSRIIEVVRSQDESGETVTPTFATL